MSLIQWSDALSVNIANIDDQHRKFIDIINRLYDARRQKSSREVIGRLIDELAAYARVHFRTEELYFDMYDYPEAAGHKEEHEKLLRKVGEFRDKYDEGSDLFVAVNLAQFLNSWMADHLVKTDKKYSRFFNDKGLV